MQLGITSFRSPEHPYFVSSKTVELRGFPLELPDGAPRFSCLDHERADGPDRADLTKSQVETCDVADGCAICAPPPAGDAACRMPRSSREDYRGVR